MGEEFWSKRMEWSATPEPHVLLAEIGQAGRISVYYAQAPEDRWLISLCFLALSVSN